MVEALPHKGIITNKHLLFVNLETEVSFLNDEECKTFPIGECKLIPSKIEFKDKDTEEHKEKRKETRQNFAKKGWGGVLNI